MRELGSSFMRANRSDGPIRRLLQKVLFLQEDERRQVARELHEDAGQLLTSLLFGLKMLEGAQSLEQVKDQLPVLKQQTWDALETMRQVSVALRPPLLEDLGLVATLRSFVRDFGARHQVKVAFSAKGEEVRLDPIHEVTVFRIVQEALTNAGKYARASTLRVAVHFASDHLQVVVADDGVGFDEPSGGAVPHPDEPVGIAGMQLRADLLGGTCTVDSAAGAGVTVTLRVPLSSTPADDKEPSSR
ncbi:sensor histidine kinase [bacterium]|nr:sensor histidine kinase [bacterium]